MKVAVYGLGRFGSFWAECLYKAGCDVIAYSRSAHEMPEGVRRAEEEEVLNSLRPAVVAMIASAGISVLITAFWGSAELISLTGTNWTLVVIFVVCVILLRKFRMNPILVMVLAGVAKAGVSLAGL